MKNAEAFNIFFLNIFILGLLDMIYNYSKLINFLLNYLITINVYEHRSQQHFQNLRFAIICSLVRFAFVISRIFIFTS